MARKKTVQIDIKTRFCRGEGKPFPESEFIPVGNGNYIHLKIPLHYSSGIEIQGNIPGTRTVVPGTTVDFAGKLDSIQDSSKTGQKKGGI